jgi:Cu+-exporting ATPase
MTTEPAGTDHQRPDTSARAPHRTGPTGNRPASDTVNLRIEGMTCGGCVARVEKALQAVPGVAAARVNLTTSSATVDLADPKTRRGDLVSAVRSIGYDAHPARPGDRVTTSIERTHETALREHRQAFIQAIGLGLPIVALDWLAPTLRGTWVGSAAWPKAIEAILCALLLWSPAGAPILVGGLRAVIHRTPNMDLLIAMGVSVAFVSSLVSLLAGAFAASHFHAAAMILAFISLGRYFEVRAKRDAASAVSALARRMPTTAQRVTDGGTEEVPVDAIEIGDRIRVAQDVTVPVDGRIVEGDAAVDESAVTGEPNPRHRTTGHEVPAGCVVREGLITLEATRVGADSTMGRIIKAVEDAQTGKTRMQRLADQVAGSFVPVVIVLALLTVGGTLWWAQAGWATAVSRAVAVLVIACPCAMGLATPTAVLVTTGRAALDGILIRDAAALEAAGRIDTVLLDKTGTLTRGEPAVTDTFILKDGDAEEDAEHQTLTLAASAEQDSQHPIARAIVAHARRHNLTLRHPTHFSNEPGRGVIARLDGRPVLVGSRAFLQQRNVDLAGIAERADFLSAQGKTVVLVAADGRCTGIIAVADQPRGGAADAIRELHSLRIETAMLTGDQARTAGAVAAELGIEDVLTDMTPESKQAEVARRRDRGRRVAFVGDGINDAPALAAADVGITFASATDVAAAAADITITHNNLADLPATVRLARRSVRIIKQNLFWAFFYNVAAIPAAALGYVQPGIAAAVMMLSSLSVVLNSLRLRSG